MKHLICALALCALSACAATRVVDAPSPIPHAAVPAASLSPDDFDAAVAVSVAEANKTAHDHHEDEAALYVCPMHPEVTSASPGKCPKCGMTLVKKEKK
jgi:hypothetical protein